MTGPDGSLWFTEFNANKIGMINPVTDGIGETLMPTPGSSPLGIGVGPDGILWVAEMDANKIGPSRRRSRPSRPRPSRLASHSA